MAPLLLSLTLLGQCAGGSCPRPYPARATIVQPAPAVRVAAPTVPVFVAPAVPVFVAPWPGPRSYFYARPHVPRGPFARWSARGACR